MVIGGHHYLLEFDEFAFRFDTVTPADTVGAARIIDVSDEAHPRVVSNIRLQVNNPEFRAQARQRPGRDRRQQPASRIRRSLLRDPPRGEPGDRRVLVHQLGAADLQHPGPGAPARGRATSSRRRRPPTSTATRPATPRCRSRRSIRSDARSGTRTPPADSGCCGWTRACGRIRSRPRTRGTSATDSLFLSVSTFRSPSARSAAPTGSHYWSTTCRSGSWIRSRTGKT